MIKIVMNKLISNTENLNHKSYSSLDDWKDLRFWEELFIYYCFFGVIGHFIEILWFAIRYLATDTTFKLPITPPMRLAIPYGLGVVGIILLVVPIKERLKLKPPSVFLLNIIITAGTEYFCAFYLVKTEGYNKHWNYTGQPFDINGYTSLSAGIVFGLLATLFLYFIYPYFEKNLKKLSDFQILAITSVLGICYMIALNIK